MTLKEILDLVGKLDDSPGEDTGRERFRRHLMSNVTEIGQIRDFVQECLRTTGSQYNCALQDLVNHIGQLLGFQVAFGRYRGVQREIGFDGHWKSPKDFHLVVEVKTTDVYAIKTEVLVHYVDELVSERIIPSWEKALGLYVVGRPDPEIRQLENAIVAEKRTHQLRTASVESVLSLAELMNEYDVSHADILAVLRPSGPKIDTIVDLMARLVAQSTVGQPSPPQEGIPTTAGGEGDTTYWLTPVRGVEEDPPQEVIERLVAREGIYAWGQRTPGRRELKPGDMICFYATSMGVIAHVRVRTKPKEKQHPSVRNPEDYPWVFEVEEPKLYYDKPVAIDAELRSRLNAFEGRNLDNRWGWFVQATRRISKHDFELLTRE